MKSLKNNFKLTWEYFIKRKKVILCFFLLLLIVSVLLLLIGFFYRMGDTNYRLYSLLQETNTTLFTSESTKSFRQTTVDTQTFYLFWYTAIFGFVFSILTIVTFVWYLSIYLYLYLKAKREKPTLSNKT